MKYLLFFLSALLLPCTAAAYVGPGLGLSTIGAVLAFIAALFFVIVGFVWYPVKRLKQRFRDKRISETDGIEVKEEDS